MSQIYIISHPNKEPKYGRAKKGSLVIPWNVTGPHRRKFIKRHGEYLENHVAKKGDIFFWGEYEPQSTCAIVSNVAPKAIHDSLCPVRNTIVPPNALNTDPYVFGDHFKNICCGIGNRKYQPGDVLLFGHIEQNQIGNSYIMKLDTVMVVKEKVLINPHMNTTQYYKASIEPLKTKKVYFYRGENYASGKQYYSYVPCLLDNPRNISNCSLPMLELNLTALGFVVNKGWRSYVAKAIPFSHKRWEMIKNTVIQQGWKIGIHVDKI